MRALLAIGFFCGCFVLLESTSHADDSTNAADTLNQSVAYLQKNPGDDALREKIIKLAATMNPKPETPDEASRHFVKAATFLKEAKDKSDYQLAVDEYRQALLLAPWWGAAYFNEGVALQSAGQFDPATAAFKLYLLTNPDDAAAVKTRIYSMEAEKELAAKRAADAANRTRQEAARMQEPKFEGSWKTTDPNGYGLVLSRTSAGSYTALREAIWGETSDVKANGRNIKITWHHASGGRSVFDLNLSDDEHVLAGTYTGIYADGASTPSSNTSFLRQ